MEPIPLIEVSGSHRQVGKQIGEHLRTPIRELLAKQRTEVSSDATWEYLISQAALYQAHSRAIFPQYIDELEAIARAAGVPFDELFLSMCEELWEVVVWNADGRRARRGCTDMAARGNATLHGDTLVAHTNDLSPENEQQLVILKVRAGNEPEFLAVSPGGVAISAGFNATGISLTGNQVDSNDIRPGVPRLLMVRAILASRRIGEALDVCLLPQRASNYNNVIADSFGEVYSMEGSALDCEPIYIEGDILAHSNHYLTSPMRPYEADRNQNGGSIVRYHRAMRLLRQNFGQLTPQLFMQLLADHQNFPASICKHGLETVTVFSMIVDLDELCAWIGRGKPCQTDYHLYHLKPDPILSRSELCQN